MRVYNEDGVYSDNRIMTKYMYRGICACLITLICVFIFFLTWYEFASEHNNTDIMDNNGRSELCKLSIAYKTPVNEKNMSTSELFGMEKYNSKPSDSMKLAQAVAEFGMLLRNSEYKGTSEYSDVMTMIRELDKTDEKIREFYDLATIAFDMYG